MGRNRKNRNYSMSADPRYAKQQQVLRATAAELGVVMYLPDYHAQPATRNSSGDANTVLFYSQTAAEECRRLDAKERAGGYIPSSAYPMYFWCFQNTDCNGRFDLNFGNHGSLDLRGLHASEVLAKALRDAWAANNA